ncbi:olfactory receptor 5P55-like [Rhinophrynus dorsalis]
MNNRNQTVITEFILLGLGDLHNMRVLLFIVFLVLYTMTLCANFLIIALFLRSQQFHSPMYFFLCHLSLCDILLCTNVIISLLWTVLRDHVAVSVALCITQFYFSGVFTAAECFVLTAMSYDRYLAIINPLRYVSIMGNKLCLHLVMSSWFIGLVLCITVVIPLSFMQFCGFNVIDHIYCDSAPLLEASCTDTYFVELECMVVSVPIVLCPFLFIIVTYSSIFLTILKISSTTGRQKAFSTCSSHLTVVCTYYVILIAKYSVPSRGHSLYLNKLMSLLYTVVTPLFNPIIYSLRNQEIRTALGKWIFTTNVVR